MTRLDDLEALMTRLDDLEDERRADEHNAFVLGVDACQAGLADRVIR